ncbi:YtxH domain-containing protein [Clostridium tertium]|uniref:YtxH-like protein n=1 Tax=Clostridium tertium TaxID=1559 RepID=A0A6N3DAZ1_9CLOT
MMKVFRGMMTGAIIGMAVTAMVLPQLDRKTQKNLRRVSKRVLNMAEDACCMVSDYIS